MENRLIRSIVTVALLATAFTSLAARAEGACAGAAGGGDWPSYGHDLSNTRTQPDEDLIGPDTAGSLAAEWTFSVAAAGGSGNIQSTPIVADGCMFVTTTAGNLFALNADSGQLVWQEKFVANGSFGGLWSPAVVDHTLYMIVSNNGAPRVVARDTTSGDVVWDSDPVADDSGAFSNAGAVVFDGLIFIGLSGGESGHSRPGGYAIINASDGSLITRRYTVPQADYDLGYSGGSMWGTAAVDLNTMYLYEGTGQPSNSAAGYEHQLTNSIVKIDVARKRDALGRPVASATIDNPRFGDIVDAYKGLTEYGYPPLDGNTPCQVSVQLCVPEDVDFGASPNLFEDSRGNVMVGAYQKTGIYHALYADTMQRAWTNTMSQMIGPPYLANAASSAYDGKQIINVGSFPGQMVAADRSNGHYNWVAPVADVTHYNPTETANGVAYTTDSKGFLDAYDTATGLPLLHHPMEADTQSVCTPLLTSGGASIARNSVFATCGAWVISYGLPAA